MHLRGSAVDVEATVVSTLDVVAGKVDAVEFDRASDGTMAVVVVVVATSSVDVTVTSLGCVVSSWANTQRASAATATSRKESIMALVEAAVRARP
jgi:hypothetical protein